MAESAMPGPVRRPISRAILGAALVVLGTAAAWRLPLAYLPTWSFPELTVQLVLVDSEDLGVSTRRYLVPLESAIRSIGGVRDTLGEVDGRGGRFRVRFAPGVDVERKAARLDSELESLRRQLPHRASLVVEPAAVSGGERSTILWLPRAGTGVVGQVDPRLVEAFRALAEVRGVEVAGERRAEVRVVARERRQDVGELRRAVDASPRAIGSLNLDGRRYRLLSVPAAGPLLERAVRRGQGLVPLGGLARVDLRLDDPVWQAHVDGETGQVLLISREQGASPLALRRAIRRVLDSFGLGEARILVDEAQPLLTLLGRLAVGAAAASLALAVLGWFLATGSNASRLLFGASQGALVPLALAAAALAFLLADFHLDVTTLPAIAVAVASALVVHALRLGSAGSRAAWAWLWLSLSAASLPVAVGLAGGPVATLLSAPARAFCVALPAAALAVFLVPPPAAILTPWAMAVLRRLLRRPWAVLLACLASGYGLFVIFGGALMPRPGQVSPATADLSLALRFVEGLSAQEAEELVGRVEDLLAEQPEILEHWSVFDRRQGALGVRVIADERPLPRLSALAGRLELLLHSLGASARVTPLAGAGGGPPLRFSDALIEDPEVDDERTFYRLILRSADVGRLRLAVERLEEMRRGHSWLKDKLVISPDWGPPAEQWFLEPRPAADPAARDRALAMIAERSRLPGARPTLALPGNPQPVSLRVVDAAAPELPGEPPELRDLLGAQPAGGGVVAAGELFTLRSALGSPSIMRQGGSFVLPITVRLRRVAIGQRDDAMSALHGRLHAMRWPVGVDRQLPKLRRQKWTEERLRLVAVASTLPLLLLFLSICRLDSIALGFAAALPPTLALAVLTPMLAASSGGLDELAVLAVASSLAVIWALSAEVAAEVRVSKPSRLAVAPGYRWLVRRLPGAACLAVAWPALLMVPTLGLSGDRHAWITALRSASLAGLVGTASAFLVLPVLLRTVDRIRFYDRQAARKVAAPPAWRAEGRLQLSVRNLSKIYGNGWRALHAVNFRLEPGIIGLLGPNGAGKTTLLRCLCGLLGPTRGQVLFQGVPVTPENLPRYRHLVGFLPQSFNAYEGFTVEAFLDFWALERGLVEPVLRRRELERVLDGVGLTEVAQRKVRELSGGMRRRIGIARALLGAPPILIIDEPTTGLDVESRNRLRESLLQAAGERIILFSTHIASDVAAAASRILILDRGRICFDGSAAALIDEADGRVFETQLEDDQLRAFSSRYRVTTRVRTLSGIKVRAVSAPDQEPAGSLIRPNLEEAYLAKLGQAGRASVEGRRSGSLLDLEG